MKKLKDEAIALLFISLIAFLLLVDKIDQPFWGHHEFNGVFYSNIARNYLRYGLWQTKFSEVINYGYVQYKEFQLHTHHPPLFPLLLAFFFKIFGIHEWSARLLAILSSLVFLYILNLLLKKVYLVSQSYLYILLAIFTPLFLYYGRLPVYEPIIAPFILLAVYFYFLWRKTDKTKYFTFATVSIFISQMIEWPGFYLGFTLFLYQLILPKKRKRRFIGIWWLGLSFLSFALIVGRNFLSAGQLKDGLSRIFITRLTGIGGRQPFTLWQFVRLELARLRSFLTTPILLLAFFWLLNYCLKLMKKKPVPTEEHFVIFFLFFGLLHIIIFPNIAWYHDYMFYYFLPPLVLAAALGFKKIFTFLGEFKILALVIIILLVFLEKKQFLHDLKNLNPHIACVKWGQEIKRGIRQPIIEIASEEDYRICPPFTNFYADQPVKFKLQE